MISEPDAGRSAWYNFREFSASASEVLQGAARLASAGSSAVGARHVAVALFCEHAIGPRLAWSTRNTDIRGLQQELKRHAEEASTGDGEAALFLASVKVQSPDNGPKTIEDLMLALLDPLFQLRPIFEGNGLPAEDYQKALPRAMKAVRLYDKQLAQNVGPQRRLEQTHQALKLPAPRGSGTSSSSSAGRPAGEPQNAGIAASKLAKQMVTTPKVSHTVSVPDDPAASERFNVLSSFGTDLVERARQGRLDPVIGRDAEIARVLQVLSRRTKNNVCLVGAPGVGKTAVAEAIAQCIAEGRVPTQLKKCKEVWSLDIGALMAGTGLRGDFEERLRAVLSVLQASQGVALLFIDELHLVLGAGSSEGNNVDAANLMKPMLARGEIRCIGATTADEYTRLILKKDAAFERRFQPIELVEPSPEVAEQMLQGLAQLYAKHHGLNILPSVPAAAVRLSQLHIRGRSLPDKAIDVLDEACCLASSEGSASVEDVHVEAVVSRWQAPPWQHQAGPLHRSFAWIQQQWSRL